MSKLAAGPAVFSTYIILKTPDTSHIVISNTQLMAKKFYGPNNILYLGYLKVKSIFQSTNHTHVVSSLFLPIQTFF